MTGNYEVEKYQYGLLVRGKIPMGEFQSLLKMWEEQYGFDLIDAKISQKYGALMALTTKENAPKWREQLGIID